MSEEPGSHRKPHEKPASPSNGHKTLEASELREIVDGIMAEAVTAEDERVAGLLESDRAGLRTAVDAAIWERQRV